MNNIINRINYLILISVLLSLSYFLNKQRMFGEYRYIGKMYLWLLIPFFALSLISLFIKENAYVSWKKFTNRFLIFAVIAILITPTSGNSGGSLGMDIYAIDKELVTFLLSGLYAVISLPLIIYKSFKNN